MKEGNKQKEMKSIYDSEQLIEWGGLLNEFLWICAGVNRKVLRQCPTDYAKYAGIGGTILFTALMAMLSGGYALFTVFDDKVTAICFGIFWGLLIFNLDRFIVNTMYSDGKVTISWREFYCGLPRIIMAIFLGVVISTPLELKIFEDAIDIRMEQDKDKMVEDKISGTLQKRDSIAQKRDDIQNGVVMFDSQITTASTVTNQLLSDLTTLREKKDAESIKITNLDAAIRKENAKIVTLEKTNTDYKSTKTYKTIIGKIGTLKKNKAAANSSLNQISAKIREINGKIAASDDDLRTLIERKQKETQNERERLQHDIDSLNTIISEANTRHKDWPEDAIKLKGSFRDKLDVEYKGFEARMKAFHEMREENSSTNISAWFIMILFIIIETAPTFFKMMIASGPYDDLLRAEMHRVKVLSDKRISDINDSINTEVQITVSKNKNRLEAEVLANKKVLEQIAAAQAQLLETAIEEWRKQELKKINENPGAYITLEQKDGKA